MIDFLETPQSVGKQIAENVKKRRLEQRLTQQELAAKAGLALATYRRFEQTFQISLNGLLQIAFALDCLSDFDALFAKQSWATIEEMQNHKSVKQRVRHD